MLKLFLLLIIFQVKHWIADFPLQGKYMLGKFGEKNWVLPLLAHAGVHGMFTLGIVSIFRLELWWLAIMDVAVHFTMDRIKASPNMMGVFKPTNKYFWWCLGFDQMVHHLTHYFIIWNIIS